MGEWLSFSEPFLQLERNEFNELMNEYTVQVQTSLQPDGVRYIDPTKPKKLPPLLCEIRSNSEKFRLKELEEAAAAANAKPMDDHSTKGTESEEIKHDIISPSKKFALDKHLAISTNELTGSSKIGPRSPMRSPAGWFWGTCCEKKCNNPAKISCEKCNNRLCSDHGTSHSLMHMRRVQAGEEVADSPDKNAALLGRIDSRFGFFPETLQENTIEEAVHTPVEIITALPEIHGALPVAEMSEIVTKTGIEIKVVAEISAIPEISATTNIPDTEINTLSVAIPLSEPPQSITPLQVTPLQATPPLHLKQLKKMKSQKDFSVKDLKNEDSEGVVVLKTSQSTIQKLMSKF